METLALVCGSVGVCFIYV